MAINDLKNTANLLLACLLAGMRCQKHLCSLYLCWLAATMAPQPSLYGRPVQVDGPGIATALAGTGLRRAPLA